MHLGSPQGTITHLYPVNGLLPRIDRERYVGVAISHQKEEIQHSQAENCPQSWDGLLYNYEF